MPRKLIDLAGQRFGRLVVREYLGVRSGSAMWQCACDCGAETAAGGSDLRNGRKQSCGCWNSDVLRERNTTHGRSKSPEYTVWLGVVRRCTNPTDKSYPYYGGRGITVCDRWRVGEDGKSGFECFLADMGQRPSGRYEIDRKDTLSGYRPDNCRWLPRSENIRNRRDKRVVVLDGREMGLTEACEIGGQPFDLAWNRLARGWSVEDAVRLPPQPRWPARASSGDDEAGELIVTQHYLASLPTRTLSQKDESE